MESPLRLVALLPNIHTKVSLSVIILGINIMGTLLKKEKPKKNKSFFHVKTGSLIGLYFLRELRFGPGHNWKQFGSLRQFEYEAFISADLSLTFKNFQSANTTV